MLVASTVVAPLGANRYQLGALTMAAPGSLAVIPKFTGELLLEDRSRGPTGVSAPRRW